MSSSKYIEDLILILCPLCNKAIPTIKPIIDETNDILLQIKCTCLEEDVSCFLNEYLNSLESLNKVNNEVQHMCHRNNHSTIKAEKYCAICQKWMCRDCTEGHIEIMPDHVLRNRELNLTCSLHKKPFIKYCNDCNQSLCSKCFNHQLHQITSYGYGKQLGVLNKELIQIDMIIKANQQYKDEFNKWIDQSIIQMTAWKNEINLLYEKNMLINNQLKQLCEVIIQTSLLIGDYLHDFPYKFILDNTQIHITNSDLSKSYDLLKKHFTERFVLVLEKEKITISENNKEKKINQPKETEDISSLLTKASKHCEQPVKIENIKSLIQLKDGKFASCSLDGLITIWTFPYFEYFKSTKVNGKFVYSICELQDGRLVSGSDSGMIEYWSLKTFKHLGFSKAKASVFILLQLKNGSLAAGIENGIIEIFNVNTYDCVYEFQTPSNVFFLIQLQDNRLVWSTKMGVIQLQCIYTNKSASFKAIHPSVNALIQLKDQQIALGTGDGYIEIHSIDTFECMKTLKEHFCIWSLLQLKDGRLVSGGNKGMIKVWSLKTNECLESFEVQLNDVKSLIQIKDGSLISCSYQESYSGFASTQVKYSYQCYLHKWKI